MIARPTWERSARIRYAATISPCGHYRYDLEREFDAAGPWVMFLGLNPSTADGQFDDHTIRREMDFGQGFGFPNLVKCNLYALRSTDPRGVVDAKVDPVGPDNDATIRRWLPRVQLVVLAWEDRAAHAHEGLGRPHAAPPGVRRDGRSRAQGGAPWADEGQGKAAAPPPAPAGGHAA